MDNPVLPLDKLLFRRQFILGPHYIERLTSWQNRKINDSMFLTVHPDLQIRQTSWEGKSITLLGYILDPDNPELNDLDIINRLICEVERADNILRSTDNLGGRWILVFDGGKDLRLFHDATGCRQVHYTTDQSQGMWCASQPGIIAEQLNLEMDEDALSNFINSPACKERIEYWWPGDSSPFKEIRLLLPNHYIDLNTGECHRFWPSERLGYISYEEALNTSCKTLKGLIKSAYNRFDLAVAVTGGWDSRLLLAATREMSESVFYYTLMYNRFYDLTEESPDIRTPAILLPKLGLKHNIIRCPSHADKEFKEIYKRNVTTAHDAWVAITQGIYQYYPQNTVCMKGVVSEIARCYPPYRLKFFEKLNGTTLARLTDMGKNPFAIKQFEMWLSNAREAAEKCHINIGDLLLLEGKLGSWYAMNQLEWDIAQEVFEPFNCRNLIEIFLKVDEKYTRQPANRLHKRIIIEFWPDVLREPINPTPFGLRPAIKKLLVRANVYHVVQRYILTPVQRYMYTRK
jgi:hypothetical protein